MSRPVAFTLMLAIGAAAFFAGRMSQIKAEARAETKRALSTEERAGYVTREAYDVLQAKLTQAEATIESQERELVKASAEAPEPAREAPQPEPGIDEVSESAPRFVFEGEEEMLRSIDWKEMGEALNKMPALLHELRDAFSEDPPDQARIIAAAGKIQGWNGKLLGQASKMAAADLSGTGTNGIWTHPVLVVNQVYATLQQSDHRMTEPQISQLQQIGDQYKEAEARRVAAAKSADSFGLEEVIGEAALRDALFAAIDGILTTEQQEILHPAQSRGYTTADLFSSSLLWGTLIRPLQFGERSDLGNQVASTIISSEKVAPAQQDMVRTIVTEWASALPDKTLEEPAAGTHGFRFMAVTHITDCAKQCLKLRRELAGRVPDPDFQRRMKEGKGSLVWFKRG